MNFTTNYSLAWLIDYLNRKNRAKNLYTIGNNANQY